jgi:hypothetical protein
MSLSSFVLLWYPPWERGLLEFFLDSGMVHVLVMLIFGQYRASHGMVHAYVGQKLVKRDI